MGNEVATVSGFALAQIAKGLKRTRAQAPSFGGKPYLKFGTDGEWTIGAGARDAVNGSTAVLNIGTLKTGYVCWTDYSKEEQKERKRLKKPANEKLGEEMALAVLGGVDPTNLPETSWEWKQQQSIEGFVRGANVRQFVYNTSSLGGLEAMDGVLSAVTARLDMGETVYLNPMVRLDADWYDHSDWGKTYKPALEIVGWADENGVPEGAGVAPAKTAEVDEVEVEVEDRVEDEPEAQEDDVPVRRRRR